MKLHDVIAQLDTYASGDEYQRATECAADYLREFEQLKALVKSFFEDYLNLREESEGGRMFSPIHVSCSRALKLKPLSELVARMRELSGAE